MKDGTDKACDIHFAEPEGPQEGTRLEFGDDSAPIARAEDGGGDQDHGDSREAGDGCIKRTG